MDDAHCSCCGFIIETQKQQEPNLLNRSGITIFVFFVVVIAGLITCAHAQQTTQAHHFYFSDTLETTSMEDALGKNSELVQSSNKFLLKASYDYANDILTGTTTQNPTSFPFVNDIQTLTVGGGILIHPRIWIGMNAPLHYVRLSKSYVANQFDPQTWKFGDLSLYSKFRVTNEDSPINVAFSPHVILPTGSDKYFASDDSYGMGGNILLDTSIQKWKFFTHAGMTYASNSQFLSINRRKTFNYGFGTFYEINNQFGINGEWIQGMALPHPIKGQSPTQINLGLRYNAGIAKIFVGGGVHRIKFTSNSHPLSLYAGVKFPFGAKKINTSTQTSEPDQSNQIQEETQTNLHLKNAIESISGSVVYFGNNQSSIKNEYNETLNTITSHLQSNQGQIKYVLIKGYCDPRGDAKYNQWLSEKRAKAVKKYLVKQGINEELILTNGFGSTNAKGTSPKDYPKLRRVEFEVIKK